MNNSWTANQAKAVYFQDVLDDGINPPPSTATDTLTITFLFKIPNDGTGTSGELNTFYIFPTGGVSGTYVLQMRIIDSDGDGNFTATIRSNNGGAVSSSTDDAIAYGTQYCVQITDVLADDDPILNIAADANGDKAECGTGTGGMNVQATGNQTPGNPLTWRTRSVVLNMGDYIIDNVEISW